MSAAVWREIMVLTLPAIIALPVCVVATIVVMLQAFGKKACRDRPECRGIVLRHPRLHFAPIAAAAVTWFLGYTFALLGDHAACVVAGVLVPVAPVAAGLLLIVLESLTAPGHRVHVRLGLAKGPVDAAGLSPGSGPPRPPAGRPVRRPPSGGDPGRPGPPSSDSSDPSSGR